MNIAFFQFRSDETVRDSEFATFKKLSGLPDEYFHRFDMTKELYGPEVLDGMDVLVAEATGEWCVGKGDVPEMIAAMKELFDRARAEGMPILAICFGAQMFTHIYGGKMVVDKAREEVGTLLVTKTAAAAHDPIMSQLPDVFDAMFGHEDIMEELPPGAINLARTKLCTHSAYTFEGEPTYCFGFHPDLDPDEVMYRVRYYADVYEWSQEDQDRIEATLKETPIARQCLDYFFNDVVHGGKRYGKLE